MGIHLIRLVVTSGFVNSHPCSHQCSHPILFTLVEPYCGFAPDAMHTLLEAVFFEAHVAGQREIEDRQLDEAALSLEQPQVLAEIRAAERSAERLPFEMFEARAEKGHYVEIVEGKASESKKHRGKRGEICKDDKSGMPYKVKLADGNSSCLDCAPGRLTVKRNQDACKPCQRGRFAPNNGTSSCLLCPRGKHGGKSADHQDDGWVSGK